MSKISKSSREWLKEHFTDPYVKQAQLAGYRSRAVYKLIELQERYHLFKSGMTVVDLGAAPGGWSQLLVKWVKPRGRIIALDILPMEPLEGVEFFEGDFTDDAVLAVLETALNEMPVDWVVSDMAPNLSGMAIIDMPRSMMLVEMALEFAKAKLKPEGGFLVKAFQGAGFDQFLGDIRRHFKTVHIRKPKASRDRSKEIYILAKGKR